MTRISGWSFFFGSSSRQQAVFPGSAHSSTGRSGIRPRGSDERVLISGRYAQYLEGEIDVPV
jgi:hypothetical protein